jgi:predicted alpha/beta superfamily hydrolase
MKTIFLYTILLISIHPNFFAQKSDYGASTTAYDISSDEGKEYKLKITLPHNYDNNKTYKVLYYLDAWWLSELVLGSYAILSLSEKINDVVFVGISIEGDVLDWNMQRTYDYTPSIYDMPITQTAGLGKHAIKLDSTTTGGAHIFLEFLESKVFNFIDNKFSNLDNNRGFIGHSFGGLFGFYVMQNKPQLFTDFIIISPSLWWNKSELLYPELFNDFTQQKKSGKLYLSYGKNESNWIVESNIKMKEILSNLEQNRLEFMIEAYDKTNHNSILSKAIYNGLCFLYKK